MEKLKRDAQSEDVDIRATAQYVLGNHIFEVKDKGKTGFPYILIDNHFHIQLSSSHASTKRPFAYVQISSHYLCHVSPQEAERELRAVISRLGKIEGEPSVSRADLFVDFCTFYHPGDFPPCYVARAQKLATYAEGQHHTGITIGMGGHIGFRLYNKTREVRNRYVPYLYELWDKQGWDGSRPVWRAEFEVKHEALKEFSLTGLPELVKNCPSLWRYLTTQWLRLTVPNPSDSHRERWPTHPLWEKLSSAFDTNTLQPMLSRCKSQREPSDDYVFQHAFAGMTSFMAREGIEDIEEGIRSMFSFGKEYHNHRSRSPYGFQNYIKRKVREKTRRYNTEKNPLPERLEK